MEGGGVSKFCCKMFTIGSILLLSGIIWGTETVSHSLLGTCYTAVNTDVFTCVLWLDGEAVDSYSSNGTDSVPRRNWMREGRGRYLWKSVKRLNKKHWNRGRTDILKNDTGLNMPGAAVLQGKFGCEIKLNPDSGARLMRAFAQYGWNGEDFLSFNLSRLQWEASTGSAVPIKSKWNRDQGIMKETKKYLEDICVMHLLNSLFYETEENKETHGEIRNLTEPRQDYNTRHRYGLLVVPPVWAIVILILGLRWWCTQRTEDSGCFSHFLTRRWSPDLVKPSSVDSSS